MQFEKTENDQRITFEGLLQLTKPSDATLEVHDVREFIMTISSNPTSKIWVGVFPSPDGAAMTQSLLRDEIGRFMNDCAKVSFSTYETPADFDKEGYLAYQAVAKEGSNWWIARLFCRRGGRFQLLAHWKGDEDSLRRRVLPVFVSIDPILSEDADSLKSFA